MRGAEILTRIADTLARQDEVIEAKQRAHRMFVRDAYRWLIEAARENKHAEFILQELHALEDHRKDR